MNRYRLGITLILVLLLAITAAAGTAEGEGEAVVPQPVFSRDAGFYDKPFTLAISAEDGLSVYYTLDGSVPDETDIPYRGSLTIADASRQANVLSARTDTIAPSQWGTAAAPREPVDKATVVRAVAVDANGVRSAVSTAVYFVGFQNKGSRYRDFRIISLAVEPGDLFDPARGIYIQGDTFEQWRRSDRYDPSLDEWLIPGNYLNRGREWERPAWLQVFEGGRETFAAGVGIRIHGGASRDNEQKSFNVYTRPEYGTTVIDYDLYDGENLSEADGRPITAYDSFILRNCGNDSKFARIRDQLIQGLVRGRSFVTQAMTPCIVFINGEFWGHYEITEKLTDDYIRDHFGVAKKNVVLIKNGQAEEGTEEDERAFAELWDWIRQTDFAGGLAYRQLSYRVDLDSLAEYMSVELYICNWDFGDNNVAMWKARDRDPDNPWADGRWRFILYDTEYSTGLYGEVNPWENAVEKLRGKNCFIGDLFFGAMENTDFRARFRKAYDEVTTVDFADGRVRDAISQMSARYRELVTATYDRFWPNWPGGPGAAGAFSSQVQDIRDFFFQRRGHSDKHVTQLFRRYEK